MAFLISQIREQKILEMEVSVDKFLEENSISEQAMIYEFTLDKELFPTEENAREYIKDKCYWDFNISDIVTEWVIQVNSPSQFDLMSEVEIQIRNGVTVKAADLKPVLTFEEMRFNDKGEVNLSSKFGTINLSEGLPHIIEIAKVAEGEHPSYGKLNITQEHLESMVTNFNTKVTGVDLSVNEDHKKNEAFGWFKDIFLSFDKQTLHGQVQWNTKGVQALSEKEYRYFSPEFRFNYVHPHSGEEHGPTLVGGALTNYPFLKMSAITELNNKTESTKDETMSEKTIELSVHTEKVVELSERNSALELDLNAKTETVTKLTDEVKELKATIELNTKKVAHQALFDTNKINAAQLVALNEGKGTMEVMALGEDLNLSAKGTDKKVTDTIELSDGDKDLARRLELTDEEYIAANK